MPQPTIAPPDTTDFSLPAAPAQFDTGKVRSVKLNSQVKSQQTQKKNEDDDFQIMNLYKNREVEQKSDNSTSNQSNSFDFGSLSSASSKPVINFHALNKVSASNVGRVENSSTNNEPSRKRRKLIVKPVGFIEKFPSSQVDSFSSSVIPPTQQQKPTQSEVTDTKEQGKRYVKEVMFYYALN